MPHHKALFLAGPHASGKSTFIDILSSLLPHDLVGASTPHQLTQQFGKASLYNHWLNVSADIPSDIIDNTGTFKLITGKDLVGAEIKRVQEKLRFIPTTKHIFSANQLPEVYESDNAFWRRILIVPFPETVPREERVDNLDEKLVENEASGILNWILEGYNRLVEQNGFTSDLVPEETRKRWWSWSTSVVRFYSRCLRRDLDSSEKVGEVYQAYKEFCRDEGMTPVSRESFGKKLKEFPHIGSECTGGGRGNERMYTNIRIAEGYR
jgi:putative DNA primase/helicase